MLTAEELYEREPSDMTGEARHPIPVGDSLLPARGKIILVTQSFAKYLAFYVPPTPFVEHAIAHILGAHDVINGTLSTTAVGELVEEKRLILPVWHGVTLQDVYAYSPMLADRFSLNSDRPIEDLVGELRAAILQCRRSVPGVEERSVLGFCGAVEAPTTEQSSKDESAIGNGGQTLKNASACWPRWSSRNCLLRRAAVARL